MEIVRQRKKRLFAWILTLVLCVGMWQGTVQATGNEGGDGSDLTGTETPAPATETPVEGSENTEEVGVTRATTRNVYITCDFSNAGDKSTNLTEWNYEYSGGRINLSKLNYAEELVKDVVITNKTSINGTELNYEHMIITWSDADSLGNRLDTGFKYGREYTFDGNTGSEIRLYGGLGQSIAVTFWEGISNGIPYGNKAAEPIIIRQDDAAVENANIILPSCTYNNDFFKGWNTSTGIINAGVEYKLDYSKVGELEEIINIAPEYDYTVTNKGSYSLVPDIEYTLGAGSWKVGDYTYTGNNNFYVESSNTYKFE